VQGDKLAAIDKTSQKILAGETTQEWVTGMSGRNWYDGWLVIGCGAATLPAISARLWLCLQTAM
jgi:hypothetical protein